jgi:hypothetical protein
MSSTAHLSTRRLKLVLFISLLLGVFSASGYLQAAMLQPSGYRTAAWIYVVLFVASAVGIVGTTGTLVWRALRRNSDRPAI